MKTGSRAWTRRARPHPPRVYALLALSFFGWGCRSAESDGPQGMGGDSSTADNAGGSSSSSEDIPGSFTPADCPEGVVGFAEEIVQASWGEGEDFGHDQLPDIVLGGPEGGGCCAGSLDVASLGNGGHVVLAFGERSIIDGPGADFLVFENGFWAGGDEEHGFMEFGRVEVSEDGEQWFAFPCDSETGKGCAGTRPIFAHPQEPEIDVFDPAQAGGDGFDLKELGITSARYVRVTDIPDDGMGFDLDAVALVNGQCN